MKYMRSVIIICLGLFFYGYLPAIDLSHDDFVVNAIKKESNLTQSDLRGWNLFGPSSLSKVKSYIVMCSRFTIANTVFATVDELYESMKTPFNSAWLAGTCIAKNNGCDNLIQQGTVALLLLENIGINKQGMSNLYDHIVHFKSTIESNQKLLLACVNREKAERSVARVGGMFKYVGGLFVAGVAASVAYQQIINLNKMWFMVKDVGKTAGQAYDWWNKPVQNQ